MFSYPPSFGSTRTFESDVTDSPVGVLVFRGFDKNFMSPKLVEIVKSCLEKAEEKYDIKFDEVIVESSPFLRCLQTASRVAQVLDVPSIHINYRVSESLYDTCFDDDGVMK